ncbi:MAG: CoB--CoM heterodisulfide reductase subunit B [Candidatus Lokiarchaeota archaeon]|nr:CoB--CoM heterodisulfide reductase subunit B [Candidatus Lokiarchaeota archaeon]
MVKYLFFKGCTIPAKLPNIEELALKLLPKMGVEIEEIDTFSCCPDPIQLQGANQYFWLATAARNIAIAEEKGLNIMTLCNGCLNSLAIVNHKLKNNPELKAAVNNVLKEIGKEFKGTIEIKHLLQVLKDDIGLDKIKNLVTNPLTGVKIASHPGCHILCPEDIIGFDDPTDPINFDKLVEALGATSIDYIGKANCCGVSLSLAGDKEASNKAIRDKLVNVKEAGAQVLTTGCPFCFTQFDMGQITASRTYPELKEEKIPVLYAIELIGLALGLSQEDVGYKTHKIKTPLNI